MCENRLPYFNKVNGSVFICILRFQKATVPVFGNHCSGKREPNILKQGLPVIKEIPPIHQDYPLMSEVNRHPLIIIGYIFSTTLATFN